ncbi:DUF2948 family protein [Paracoccus suum]|uniref:DUF2948 family protein n=1 Tax=Paracoccus suum TaxID=2259340 RepID=A0A344PMQ5_9RHOB|nr:DUF2948 family protein [Paracoccus suum]AXC50660.1 DUF2948 family protein [Paracoccus suum]
MPDAGFADAGPGPVMLRAEDAEDLRIISALAQDAVLPVTEISWQPAQRRLTLLLNRFRWEDQDAARAEGRPFERVQALMVISDATRLSSDGIDRADSDLVLSLLALEWQPGEDGTGRIALHFAGDGTLVADVECISVDLRDVTRPYAAPSGKAPQHPE